MRACAGAAADDLSTSAEGAVPQSRLDGNVAIATAGSKTLEKMAVNLFPLATGFRKCFMLSDWCLILRQQLRGLKNKWVFPVTLPVAPLGSLLSVWRIGT